MENNNQQQINHAAPQQTDREHAIGSPGNTGLKRGTDHVKDREATIKDQSVNEAPASAASLTGNNVTAQKDSVQRMTENVTRETRSFDGNNDADSNKTQHPGE